jgi:glycine hydroxymethyltransferase
LLSTSYSYLERLESIVKEHEQWRLSECLNLIPSENRSSTYSRSFFMRDLGNRYTSPDKFYRGTKYLDELVSLTEEIARKVFNARYADVRPLSGHVADLAILASLTKNGDKILSVSPDDGGYPGVSHLGLGRILGLRNIYFPFSNTSFNINAKETKSIIKSEKPSVVFFGSSFILFPHPVREISEEEGSVYVYDGSHVLGLIAGGVFQDPLREGCSFLIGSTHKSFPGPQGGIILSNNQELFERVSSSIFPGIIDNFHLNRVASLAVSLLEMMEFGKPYARSVVQNAQTLARALEENEVRVKCREFGYTKSHQVLLDYEKSKLSIFAQRLEQANIIIDNGGRIGVSEVTRLGFGQNEMELVAELIGMVINAKKPVDFVMKRVRSIIKDFQEPKYVLKSLQAESKS